MVGPLVTAALAAVVLTPTFYELHLWLWKPNPAGMFEDWNPDVRCP